MTTRRETDTININAILMKSMNENFNDYGTVRRFNALVSDLCNKILKYTNDYDTLDISIITNFMNFLTIDRCLRYNTKSILSITKNSDFKIHDILTVLETSMKYFPLNELGNLINDALCMCDDVHFFIKLYSDRNLPLPAEILEKSCEKGFPNNIREIYYHYPNKLTESNVNHIISHHKYNDDVRLLYELLSLKYPVYVDSLKKLMINGMLGTTQITKLFKMIVLTGIKIDNDILEYACSYKLYEIIEFLLLNDIKPTKQCYANVVQGHTRSNSIYEKQNCIELLVKYGYVLTYPDFLEATRNKLTIKNLEKYNFQITQDFLKICSDVGFYPDYGSIINLVPDSICIENECTRAGNIEKIKKLVSMGCKITEKAVENACEHKNNLPTLRYLLQNGGQITTKALVNMADSSGSSSMLLIAEHYEIQEKKRNQQKENQILPPSTVPVECPKKNIDDIDHTKGESSCEKSKDCNSKNEENNVNNVANSKMKLNGDTKKNITDKTFTTYDLSNIEITMGYHDMISASVIKTFSEKEKTGCSYLDFRRKIYEYIVEKSLFNLPSQKNIFILDKKLSVLSSIKQNSYIKFEDLDKFISCIVSKNK